MLVSEKQGCGVFFKFPLTETAISNADYQHYNHVSGSYKYTPYLAKYQSAQKMTGEVVASQHRGQSQFNMKIRNHRTGYSQ